MNRWLLIPVLAICWVGPGQAQITSIDDIQQYNAVTGVPESPYANQIVTVEGRIYVVKGTYSSGGHYIQGATGGINVFDPTAPTLTYGDRVQVTGIVWTDTGEIYLDNPTFTLLGHEVEPSPLVLSVPALISDYENVGSFVSVTGTVANKVSDRFDLTDGSDVVAVHIDSDTGVSLAGVDDGDRYTVLSPCFIVIGEIRLSPRMQSDLIEIPTGTTIIVNPAGSGDATTIQAGLDLAQAGDLVQVVAGVYYEHDILMKSGVTLRSETALSDGVVIDAQFLGRVIMCDGVSGSTRIEGFTLVRGLASGTWPDNVGAGINCSNSSPTIINCTVCLGIATYGGGVYCGNSSPVLVGCTIAHNDANFGGGLFFFQESHPSLENTLVAYNTTGSAMGNSGDSSATLSCCDLFGNDGGDWVGDIAGQFGVQGNIAEDPQFCSAAPEFDLNLNLQSDSPCAPAQSACGLIGALNVGCGGTPTERTSWGKVKVIYR